MDTTPTPTKTVLLAITIDGQTVIASPAGGTPRVIRTLDELRTLVDDPTVKPAKTADAGFDVADFFRGLGRVITDYGAAPTDTNGEQKR